ncbi:MAG: hypothetical protein AB7H66_13660 [Hyphomonadaceae bacterium]
MATIVRLVVGWSLVGWAVWLAVQAWPQWNGLPVLALSLAGFALIEWGAYKGSWSEPFFPAQSSGLARAILVANFVAIQALLLVLVAASFYPSRFGDPDARFFLPLVVGLVVCGIVYRVFRRSKSRSDGT